MICASLSLSFLPFKTHQRLGLRKSVFIDVTALKLPTDPALVTLCRAEYDVASAQRKIFQAGLPELLALRLEAGI